MGLTGGLGCGKSTAGKIFAELGFRRIDCDEIVRDEVLTDPKIVSAVAARLGADVLDGDGRINRARVGARVFSNAEALRWLEELVHPEVSLRWKAAIAAAPEARWLVEIPLLFERDLQKEFDLVVCVACSPEIQLARLEQRGMTRTQAEQRIVKQLPLARKIELSDCVLSNDGTPEFLRAQIENLVSRVSR
jgi:dephospho-CoA kinase